MPRVLLLIVVALAAFLLPAHELLSAAKILRTHADVFVVGNSVIRHASKCDPRSDSIPELLAERRARPALDLSLYGQTPEQELNLAALALRNPSIKHIIVPMSLSDFGDWDTLSLQELLFYRAANPELPAVSLGSRIGPMILTGPPGASRSSFVFDGVHYPDYDHIKERFEVEKRMMPCPENDGLDQHFNRAFYAFQYSMLPLRSEVLDLIAAFARQAQERGVDVIWPISPIDYDLIEHIDPAVTAAIQAHVLQLKAAFQSRGIHVLDLTGLLENQNFADRWCACGHLQLSGRQRVADAWASALRVEH